MNSDFQIINIKDIFYPLESIYTSWLFLIVIFSTLSKNILRKLIVSKFIRALGKGVRSSYTMYNVSESYNDDHIYLDVWYQYVTISCNH
jgi:hypothetical protein